MTCCCGAGGSTPHGSAASTIAVWPLIWYAWPWRWVIATSRPRWPAPSRPEVPTVRSLALRCQGLVDGEVEPALEAVAFARRAPMLVEHAGACEDAAELLARGGRRDEAVALLAEALERYEQAGAAAWAGRVRAQLRALGVRPAPRGSRHRPAEGWESLTATERAVSLLVAEGL